MISATSMNSSVTTLVVATTKDGSDNDHHTYGVTTSKDITERIIRVNTFRVIHFKYTILNTKRALGWSERNATTWYQILLWLTCISERNVPNSIYFMLFLLHLHKMKTTESGPPRPRICPRFEGHRIIHELAGHVVLFTSLQMACA